MSTITVNGVAYPTAIHAGATYVERRHVAASEPTAPITCASHPYPLGRSAGQGIAEITQHTETESAESMEAAA